MKLLNKGDDDVILKKKTYDMKYLLNLYDMHEEIKVN
jgi:hypothetical protein